MRVRSYGSLGPLVIVIHGGPGAPGTMAPVARELAPSFRVLEPFQRASGGAPLTVARHVSDLFEVVSAQAGRPALVGSSWGAMLALAYSAAYPDAAAALVLVGCGTFDDASRAAFQATVAERLAAKQQRFTLRDESLVPAYSYDVGAARPDVENYDPRGYAETWTDMLRLQQTGVYPAAFAAIQAPVLMLHGAADPHPGAMIRDRLKRYIPHLEYRELDKCGHYPWLERQARDEFFAFLRDWLVAAVPPAKRAG